MREQINGLDKEEEGIGIRMGTAMVVPTVWVPVREVGPS